MTLRVDGARLWRRLLEMAEIGATPAGGVHRLAASDEDRAARDLLRSWCDALGLVTTVDALGSMFARMEGADPDAEPVLLGSHLDSQPMGGRFDGALGVLAALEVVETVLESGEDTVRPLEIVNWTNEEGSRFPPAMACSGAFAGAFDVDRVLGLADAAGRTLGEELDRIGYAGTAAVGGRAIHASLELHIEQGPILESAGRTIGVVTGVQGARWYDVSVVGSPTHAGPSPMTSRRDAMRGAARLIDRLFAEVLGFDDAARLAVGEIRARPGSRNTVPGRVDFTVDLRHPDDAALAALDAALRGLAEAAAEATGVDATVAEIWHAPSVRFAPRCVQAVRDAADRLGYTHMDVVSGAGHDSVYLQRVCDAGMVFVPCAGGVSHAESERVAPEDAEAGANVLLAAARSVAGTA